MCFITWTIVVLVVLMSNSNNPPVARTTFSQPAWLSAARTLRWNLEGPATAQPEPTKQSLVATPVQRSEDAKLLCPATVPPWAVWYAVRSIIARCAAQYTTLHTSKCTLRPPSLPQSSCTGGPRAEALPVHDMTNSGSIVENHAATANDEL